MERKRSYCKRGSRRREAGAAMVETALLVGLIALASIHAISFFGEKAEKVLCKGKLLSADLNGDTKIDSHDISAFPALFGAVTAANEHADLNCDDVVNADDIAVFTSAL
ncbi:MAG: hypothetical protein KDD62_08730 [Bdellovibrionales bacterium]|nr:hypothetical protein [Bdellovibrionales bacterium]